MRFPPVDARLPIDIRGRKERIPSPRYFRSTSGDEARAERIIAELEVPYYSTKRPNARREYEDLIGHREVTRSLRRRLEGLRKRLEKMTAAGAPARETRPLRSEIEVLEELYE